MTQDEFGQLQKAAAEIERALCAQVCIDLGRYDCAEAILHRESRRAAAQAAEQQDEQLASDLLILQRFMDSVFGEFPEHDDIDGALLQEIAESCGLLEKQTISAPCGETCQCADCGIDGPTECYRVQPVMRRARRASAFAEQKAEGKTS